MSKRTFLLVLFLAALLTACGYPAPTPAPTVTPMVARELPTATATPSPKVEPTAMPEPASPTPYPTTTPTREPLQVVHLECIVPLEGESWEGEFVFVAKDELAYLPWGCMGDFVISLEVPNSTMLQIELANGVDAEIMHQDGPWTTYGPFEGGILILRYPEGSR